MEWTMVRTKSPGIPKQWGISVDINIWEHVSKVPEERLDSLENFLGRLPEVSRVCLEGDYAWIEVCPEVEDLETLRDIVSETENQAIAGCKRMETDEEFAAMWTTGSCMRANAMSARNEGSA